MNYPLKSDGTPDKTKAPIATETVTWRRNWGGGRAMHGQRIATTKDQHVVATFKDGLLHGPYTVSLDDRVFMQGNYVDGKKHGRWIHRGNVFVYRNGKVHGPTQTIRFGKVETLTYEDGILTHRNGTRVDHSLLEALRSSEIEPSELADELTEETQLEFVATPLTHVVAYLNDFHEIAIKIDDAFISGDVAMPRVTESIQQVTLSAGLILCGERNGFDCEYRPDGVWIVPKAHLKATPGP